MGKAGNRGGAATKKAPAVTSNEDDSYIVFGDAKSERKSKKQEQKDPAANNGIGNAQASSEDAPQKPDTKKLIGGASWTGKLPVNMLSEHCQKQKWFKPEYTMVIFAYLLN